MIGKTLNHFKVLDRLGKGGMGEVYLAEDSKLKRKVALKVLPEEVARDPARLERFQREAESIAALNHPNIVTIYSTEEADGVHFLIMELVEGDTLVQFIPSNGFDVESFVRYSAPVADALSAAHEKGIVHRDLKPGNIMISHEGRVKVLDFGLAKLMRDDSDPNSSHLETHAQTEAGVVLGTMPYMSPEQIQGKKLDQRSDIFSLGIIFYEMITGRRPFHGDTSAELISSIMRDTPEPIGDLKPGTPEHLERIIRRCLQKDPRDRYQTARDVYNELRDLTITSGSSTRRRDVSSAYRSGEMWIAVLPFQHPTADPEMEAFADGLGQDITAALSMFSYLSVMARNSAMRLKGQAYDVRSASEQLGARYLLQGAIRKSGSHIRVNFQLIDTSTGTNLWTETFNRDLKTSDIFTLQDEITDRVAATVADNFGVLVRSMVASFTDKSDEELTAKEYVLRWFAYEGLRLAPEEHKVIRATLRRAVERYPRDAEVWACLAFVHFHAYVFKFNEEPDSLDQTMFAARRAVELDRSSQIAYEALLWAYFIRGELAALPAVIDRVISLNPRNSHTLAVVGLVLVHTQQFDRAVEITQRAIDLNPHHAGWFHFPFVWNHYVKEEYEQVIERAKRANMPGFFWTHLAIASACGELGRKAEAAAAVKELLVIDPEFASHARWLIEPWHKNSGFVEPFLQGLRKAGLVIPDTDNPAAAINISEVKAATPVTSTGSMRVSSEPRIPLIGRDHERSDLDQMLNQLVQGKGGLVLLGGEPGVGKTRLAAEILQEARERGMLALTGHAYEEQGAPFITGAEILDEMIRLVPPNKLRTMLGENASEMTRLLPELRTRFPDIPEPIDLPLEQQRRYLFKNVLEFLQRASRDTAMVMLLDDLHWADESSLLLLEHIAPHLSAMPVLMLGTYRDVELDVGKPFEKTLARLVRQNLATRLSIKRLQETDVAELLSALGGANPPVKLVSAIFHETEGNPFFVTEVFRHLSEEGLLFDGSNNWKTDLDVQSLDVPEGVRLVIGRRLERLSAGTQSILKAAAVIGRDFDVRLLEAFSEFTPDSVIDGIDEAEKARLVAPVGKGRESKYSFTHELIRHTLLGNLSLPRRQRYHLRIADAMEKVYAQRLEDHASDLAYHLYQAGASADFEKTMHYLKVAGNRSLAAAASDKAIYYFDTALSLLEDEEAKQRAELLFKRGTAYRAASLWEECERDWQDALSLFEAQGEAESVARICSDLAYQAVWKNETGKSKALAMRGLKAVGNTVSKGHCLLLSSSAHAHSLENDYESAQAFATRAVQMAEQLGDDHLLGQVLVSRIYVGEHHIKALSMVADGERALEIVRRLGSPWDLSNALGITILGYAFLGDLEKTEKACGEVESLAMVQGDLGVLLHVDVAKYYLRLSRGDLAGAEESTAHGIESCREQGFPWIFAFYSWLGLVQLLQGRWADASTSFAEGVRTEVAEVYRGFSQAFELLGKAYDGSIDADSILKQARDILPEPGVVSGAGSMAMLQAVVESFGILGKPEGAPELYPMFRVLLDEEDVFAFYPELVQKLAGIAAALDELWEEAEQHLMIALKQADELPYRVEQPEVRRWYAWMLLKRNTSGDRERAQSLLTEARAMYEKIGMPKHVPIVDSLLKQATMISSDRITSGKTRTRSIAVLPFFDMSPSRDHDWFCEGIAEEILNALTKLPELRVATRSSAFRFKDAARDIAKIGETLGVTTLLEGSVRTAGSQLRVTAQLVNAADGYQLWSESFDRKMQDVFAIQDEIARSIVKALKLRLTVPSGETITAGHSKDLEAYHLFLKGRHFRYTGLDLRNAKRCLEEAVARDPGYALARILLAETLAILVLYCAVPPSIGLVRVREELQKTQELAPDSPHALGIEALLAFCNDWDTKTSIEKFERALLMDPDNVPVRAWYTWSLVAAERVEEAVEQAYRIMELDPESSYANVLAGDALLMAGHVEEALKLHKKAEELAPDSVLSAWNYGLSLAEASRWKDAIPRFRKAAELSSGGSYFLGILAWSLAAAGQRAEAQKILSELERRAATEYVSPLLRVLASSELDRPEETRKLLSEALNERSGFLVVYRLPIYRKLRNDPLMQELARRLLVQ